MRRIKNLVFGFGVLAFVIFFTSLSYADFGDGQEWIVKHFSQSGSVANTVTQYTFVSVMNQYPVALNITVTYFDRTGVEVGTLTKSGVPYEGTATFISQNASGSLATLVGEVSGFAKITAVDGSSNKYRPLQMGSGIVNLGANISIFDLPPAPRPSWLYTDAGIELDGYNSPNVEANLPSGARLVCLQQAEDDSTYSFMAITARANPDDAVTSHTSTTVVIAGDHTTGTEDAGIPFMILKSDMSMAGEGNWSAVATYSSGNDETTFTTTDTLPSGSWDGFTLIHDATPLTVTVAAYKDDGTQIDSLDKTELTIKPLRTKRIFIATVDHDNVNPTDLPGDEFLLVPIVDAGVGSVQIQSTSGPNTEGDVWSTIIVPGGSGMAAGIRTVTTSSRLVGQSDLMSDDSFALAKDSFWTSFLVDADYEGATTQTMTLTQYNSSDSSVGTSYEITVTHQTSDDLGQEYLISHSGGFVFVTSATDEYNKDTNATGTELVLHADTTYVTVTGTGGDASQVVIENKVKKSPIITQINKDVEDGTHGPPDNLGDADNKNDDIVVKNKIVDNTIDCRACTIGGAALTRTMKSQQSKTGSRIEFWDGVTATWKKTHNITLPADGTWVEFKIRGIEESVQMGDAAVQYYNGAVFEVSKKVTVLWVDLKGRKKGTFTTNTKLPGVKGSLNEFRSTVVVVIGGKNDNLGAIIQNNTIRGSIDLQGSIHPKDFTAGKPAIPANPAWAPAQVGPPARGGVTTMDRGFTMRRDLVLLRLYANGVELIVGSPLGPWQDDSGPNGSVSQISDVTPNRDGNKKNSKMMIIDMDSPAWGPFPVPLGAVTDFRYRASFNQFVRWEYQLNERGAEVEIPCSSTLKWGIRLRSEANAARTGYKLWSGGGDNPNDGAGDNEVVIGVHPSLLP